MSGRRARVMAVGTLLACAAACGNDERRPPIGQLLLYIETDAPLPAAPGESLGPDDPAPLFDRVRIEVFPPGQRSPCIECTHEFDVDRRIVAERRASVGITPPPGVTGYRARIRLFRAAHGSIGGEPRPDASIDVTTSLPPAPAEGIVSATVTLRTENVARPSGSLDAPVPAAPRAAEALPLWAPAMRAYCTRPPAPGEVCIPGGAFWMGNPLLTAFHAPGDSVVMRIAALAPFFLDDREVRVDRFRASMVAISGDPMRHAPDDGSPGPIIHCTYTDAIGNDEDLPVNCVSWARARAHCASRGADLPTEAQLQYAAGALEGRLYPWGEDSPTCSDAVYARAPHVLAVEHVCPGNWVLPAGNGDRDRIALRQGVLLDLAGNLSEMALDLWNLQTESCWGAGVFFEPLCTTPSSDPNANGQHTVVAGSFLDPAGAITVAQRRPAFSFSRAQAAGPAGGIHAPQFAGIGFRCARPAL